LKDLKDSHPIELAEYTIDNQIDDKPTLVWRVPYVTKTRKRIIKKIKSKY